MARSTPSAHSQRHPNRQVQLARRRGAVSKAAKATKALKTAQNKRRNLEFQDVIDKAFEDRTKLIAKIAKDFEKPEHVIRAILSSACLLKMTRRPSLRRAVFHDRWKAYQDDGISKSMEDIRQEVKDDIEDGSFSLKEIDALEETRLLNQLLHHRGAKNRGIRATSKAAQLDGRLTAAKVGDALVNLYQRTGIRAFAVFSRGNSDDPTLPYCVDSDNALNFFLQVFNHDSFALMRKFEQWSCIQDDGPDERNDLAGARSEVSHMFLDGLRYITNKPAIKMEYVKYDFAIRELYGVQLVGLPSDIKLLRASLWNLETVRRVRAGLKEGSVCWVKMTKTEHEALIAKHNTLCAELASGSLKQRATRSDKGTRRKKNGGEGGHGADALLLTATTTPVGPSPGPVAPTTMPVDPAAASINPAPAPVDLTAAPIGPTAAPIDPTAVPIDPTAVPIDPTAALVDPSMAFDMHIDPTVLEELLRMPPYEGPFIPLDFDGGSSDIHLFNIPQGLPERITDDLPILPRPELSPPASPVPTPNVSLDDVLNSLEGLSTTSSSHTGGFLHCNRDDDDDGNGSGALPAKKVRKARSDKGVRRGENRPPAPAQPPKPRKTRSDKGVRRGSRAS
ncbi:hypothetical protein B0H14DRAFT_3604203 [Mycena olivaceomarginata]|nr:hypothetical protein B0H14DRAFT_3604203 [Mycena olivaceomarginata]